MTIELDEGARAWLAANGHDPAMGARPMSRLIQDRIKRPLANELLLIIAAIVTVYIVLGVLYESYIHPITILSTIPSAGLGALLALLLFGSDLNLIAMVGIILLIGIVKKNAILMIDFALDAEREQGLKPREAIYQASLLRFRPILMTTMAAMLGALPLMIGWGEGSELRHPLGITMVGGLIFSQALTLFTTPVIYLYFDRLVARFRKTPLTRPVGHPLPAYGARGRRVAAAPIPPLPARGERCQASICATRAPSAA